MVERFLASPPATQDAETYRQFVRLQDHLALLEERIRPLFGSAGITPMVLTDAWQELVVFDSTLPSELAAYFLGMRLSVQGTNANAEVQLRVTWDYDGGGVIDGTPVVIGNNDLESVTLTGVAIAGIGIRFYARGLSSEILSGRANLHRIGSGP